MTAPKGLAPVMCKGCRGTAPRSFENKLPPGWYGLSVGVPPEITTRSGRGYLWAGLFCSLDCLERALPQLREQADLARLAYEPVVPVQRGGGRP